MPSHSPPPLPMPLYLFPNPPSLTTSPPNNTNNVLAYHNRASMYNKVAFLPKMGSNQTPIMDNNGFKEARDRSKDYRFLIVRDRKVRVSEDSSLYALCRSWLRNGLPEQTEPQYNDIVKSLPRPLPFAPQDSQSSEKKEENEEEGGGFVEHLSHQDLLQKHIKRAKRVRSRLREERLRRIARYKTRLSLLLPAIVEQHHRHESTAGNGNTS
ncbi:hypothetical protein Leryth_001428 [Lithospermum erythrorhizon]|nr:hypothetical protein Leryth_001428 [Lithospermum erythrorhizon]